MKLAEELEELNRERQAVEERILREAVAEVESWPEARRRRRGYVVAGEGWHEGVIGIVASRLVERYSRPVVLIAGTDGDWKGSGRSVPAFDLHAALGACAAHLERFGGHRAAAGLTIAGDRVEAFAAAFAAHADAALDRRRPAPGDRVDAIVPRQQAEPRALQASSAGSRRSGSATPACVLLVDGCELADSRPSATASTCASGCASGAAIPARRSRSAWAAQLDRFRREGRYDVAFRLQENRWNGVSSPQLVVRRVFDAADGFEELRDWLGRQWQAGEAAWTPQARPIFEELELADGARRSLLESPTFRMLLEAKPALAAAA